MAWPATTEGEWGGNAGQPGGTSNRRPPRSDSTRILSLLPSPAPTAPALAAALAAALLLAPLSADAKVVFVKPPPTKKVFQGEKSTAAPRAAAPAAAKKSGGGGGVTPSFGPDAGTLALPAALLAVGGGTAAALSLDPKFGTFLDKATLRDCNEFAGYEVRGKEDLEVGDRGGGGELKKKRLIDP